MRSHFPHGRGSQRLRFRTPRGKWPRGGKSKALAKAKLQQRRGLWKSCRARANAPSAPPGETRKAYLAAKARSIKNRKQRDVDSIPVAGWPGVSWRSRSSADTMPLRICLIGNKSPRAFAVRGPAKTSSDNSPICTKRRATRWLPSSWQNCSRVRGKIPMPPSGIPRQRQNSGAPNGRPRRRKPRCGLAGVPRKL